MADESRDSVGYWKEQIDSAYKRQKHYIRQGEDIVNRFLDKRTEGDNLPSPAQKDEFRLNLFHTHVSTMMSMMYGRIPRTDVSRRFADANDDLARVASELFQRLLNTSVEEPGADFPSVLRACLQDRLLPGHAVARVRYEMREEDGVFVEENAPVEYVHWKDVCWGYARTWATVPWLGFRLHLEKDEFKARFPDVPVDDMKWQKRKFYEESQQTDSDDFRNPVEETEIYEIWDKKDRKVRWWADSRDKFLEVKKDPLGLRGFYPAPQPMIANCTTTQYMPRADFIIAQDLYNEIDTLQKRISIITRAIKVVGVYDQSADGIGRMLKEGFENDLIPVDNWAAFREKGGIAGVVDWYPVAEIVQVLTTLQEVREQTIDLLYQVTGLSDILRGAQPAPRESAASSMQRARFASVRVQHLEEEFARFASDLMTLRAEVIARHWEGETILVQSNATAMMEEKQLIFQAIELIKQRPTIWPWRINIKPESIAMIDYAQLRQERQEYLSAVAGYVQAMTPLLEVAPEAAPFLMEMFKWGLAGFKGSQELEGVVDRAIKLATEKLSQPGGGNKEAEGKIAEIQAKHKAEMEQEQVKHQNKMDEMMLDVQTSLEEISAESDADALREKVQAMYGILEARVKAELDERKEEKRAQTLRAASKNREARAA